MDGEAEAWRSANAHLAKVAELEAKHKGDGPGTLEGALGGIVDRLLLSGGIVKVTPESRELLLGAFHQAMMDAVEKRERNAAGDYSPDPKSERFPAFEPSKAIAAAPHPLPTAGQR